MKSTLFSLFFLFSSYLLNAQISWAFKLDFSDGANTYTGIIALHKQFCGVARFKSNTGEILEEKLYWAPTQEDNSFWLMGENVKMIVGSLNYQPDFILARMNTQTNTMAFFFNSHVIAGMDEHNHIMYYPAEDNQFFRSNNIQLMDPSSFDNYAKQLNWSFDSATNQANNVQTRFYKSN